MFWVREVGRKRILMVEVSIFRRLKPKTNHWFLAASSDQTEFPILFLNFSKVTVTKHCKTKKRWVLRSLHSPFAYLHSYSWRVSLCDRQSGLRGVLFHSVLLCSLHHHSAGLCANLCGPEEAQETCQHQTEAARLSGCPDWCGHFAEGELAVRLLFITI